MIQFNYTSISKSHATAIKVSKTIKFDPKLKGKDVLKYTFDKIEKTAFPGIW